MTVSAGDFWVADIPFTDGSGSKKRPILVLWVDMSDVVVAAVTSGAPRSSADVVLADWKVSGLRAPSTVRLSRLDCLEQSLLIVRIGGISARDAPNREAGLGG
jgi:PemK-like, MazF-like toxin of type II toxin-antitoxin system